MYGLVNRGLQEFLQHTVSTSDWSKIATSVGIGAGKNVFVDLEQYPDALTYSIVGAACEVTGQDGASLLRDFGRYWILFTAQSAYAHLFDASDSLFDLLSALDSLHVAVAESMPKLIPPSFGVEETHGGWIVHYVSEREGLEPMVVGLLEGLLETFAIDGRVEQLDDTRHSETCFLVTKIDH